MNPETDPLAGASHEPIVDQLRDALGRASELVARLSTTLAVAARNEDDTVELPPPTDKLERELDEVRVDMQEISLRLVDTEHQLDRLMSLYVATYQLHAFLDPRQVSSAIADIAVNLLGAERFALLLLKDDGVEYEIAFSQGTSSEETPGFEGETYSGGDPLADGALADGSLRLGPSADSRTVAAVPLKIQDQIVGALVVLKLFDHKPVLRGDDRDLLDLLSAHAASALFAARLFAAKDRKLRTL
ncbi:MAG: GAF domain-containing protein, partial [Thermoanaerobaculia bacterium]